MASSTASEPEPAAGPELSERKMAVLRAVVEEYVRTGEPVGSETIAERADLGVSPATIRNEMASLEELGYLGHPHTSAGRVPTDLGYRSFVNHLPSAGGKLREAQRRAIADFFAQTVLDLEETLVGATQLLSRLTQYAGLAVPPSSAEERLAHVEFVGVGSMILVLVVGGQGRVDKRAFDRPEGLKDGDLADLSDRIGRALAGRTVADAEAETLRMSGVARGPERVMLESLGVMLGDMRAGTAGEHVLVRGVANLAGEAATWRRETIQRLFEALERESEMLNLLRVASEQDVSVTIGGEHPATGEWDASIVAAPYRAGDRSLGTIGVVGPTRMDYSTAIATVRAVARRISELATALGA
jgi:heat-inducible transcriptional repressor